MGWYMHPALTTIFGGILPFGAVSVELFFVMSAIWLHQIYYIFGFLFLVSMILVATCAEITILLCYFQLCNEDYAWWWRSVMSSGACALRRRSIGQTTDNESSMPCGSR